MLAGRGLILFAQPCNTIDDVHCTGIELKPPIIFCLSKKLGTIITGEVSLDT